MEVKKKNWWNMLRGDGWIIHHWRCLLMKNAILSWKICIINWTMEQWTEKCNSLVHRQVKCLECMYLPKGKAREIDVYWIIISGKDMKKNINWIQWFLNKASVLTVVNSLLLLNLCILNKCRCDYFNHRE